MDRKIHFDWHELIQRNKRQNTEWWCTLYFFKRLLTQAWTFRPLFSEMVIRRVLWSSIEEKKSLTKCDRFEQWSWALHHLIIWCKNCFSNWRFFFKTKDICLAHRIDKKSSSLVFSSAPLLCWLQYVLWVEEQRLHQNCQSKWFFPNLADKYD